MAIAILPSGIKKIIYKMMGYKIGKNVKLGIFSAIEGKNVTLSNKVHLQAFTIIKGKDIRLDTNARVFPGTVIDVETFNLGVNSTIMDSCTATNMINSKAKLSIGNNVKIFPECFLDATSGLCIEDGVGIGGRCLIFTHGSWQSQLDGFPVSFGSVKIKKGAWLPWGVFVNPGVTIGEYSLIGSAAVVTKSVPDSSFAAGSPAKLILQEGQYGKPLNVEKKEETFTKILSDFSNYMKYLGYDTAIEQDNYLLLTISKNSTNFIILYSREIDSSKPRADLYVSMTTPKELIQNGSVIDLEKNTHTQSKNSEIIKLFISFLGRYGIRIK